MEERAVQDLLGRQWIATQMRALWMVSGLIGAALEVVPQLVEEGLGTDAGNVTILHRPMEARSVLEHLSNQLAAMCRLVQLTVTGPLGADMVNAANLVEEVINTGTGTATIPLRQTVEQAVEGRADKQENVIHVLAKLTVTGPLGVGMVNAASLAVEVINTEPASATIRLQQTVEHDVEDRAEDHDAVIHVLVKLTVIGPHGADTVNAASRVEEDINTEPESVTIHHQQTVVKTVEDQVDEREAVIYVLVKLRVDGLTGVHIANVVARVGLEARKQDIARAPALMRIMHMVVLHVEDTPNRRGNAGERFLVEKFAEILEVTAIADGS